METSSNLTSSIGSTGSRRSPLGYSTTFSKSLQERALEHRSGGDALTVAQAFAALFTALEPNEGEREKASKQQQRVRESLEDLLALEDTYLSGSYRQRTLIRPPNDIDLLLVLDAEEYGDQIALDSDGATAALDCVEHAVDFAYPNTEKYRHSRCIQLQFAGTGIGFDLVPVFRFTEDEFWMPDAARGVWLRTNPREVQRLVSEANQNVCGEWLVPLVKLLKAWKDKHRNRVKLTGFHLEAMSYHALKHAPANEREGLLYLFEKLAVAIYLATPDIWSMGENADAYLSCSNRLRAAAALSDAALEARKAVDAEADGRPEEAHAIWFKFFGDRYPETGEKREAAVRLSLSEATVAISAGAYVSATSAGLTRPAPGYAVVRSATSHGGVLDEAPTVGRSLSAASVPEAQREWLEREIAMALTQFTALRRIDPADAAADPELWPVKPGDEQYLYAVLVGEQATNLRTRHRILMAIPLDTPATEPRVYRLHQHVQHVPKGGDRKRTRFVPRRRLRHQWRDGSMCSHARRDRWDGRLVTLLTYAADWLLRQDLYQKTGKWLGYEIDSRQLLLLNGRPAHAGHALRRSSKRGGRR